MAIEVVKKLKKLECLHLEEICLDFEHNLIDEKELKMFISLMEAKSSCFYSKINSNIEHYLTDAHEIGLDFIYYSSIHMYNYEIFFNVKGEYLFNEQFRKLTKLDIIVKVNSIKKRLKKNRKLGVI